MGVNLQAIRFNCPQVSTGITALNVRKNARELVPVPEWQAGVSVHAGHSRAAYATRGAWGKPVLIQAAFAHVSPGPRVLEIRALPKSPLRSQWQWLESLLPPTLNNPESLGADWTSGLAAQDHVLGEVKPRWITLPASGGPVWEPFELPRHRLWSAGVGSHLVEWRWQYREHTGAYWQDFAETRHRIYTILDTPRLPWLQAPLARENTQLPWTDVLDYACGWAAGAQTPSAAAAAITQAVYNLGPVLIQYGCPIFALTQYSLIYFDCSAFLELLAGGPGNGPYVNCSDCATIVSTFANALGCDLWQSRMGATLGSFFSTNPIRAIGSSEWMTPCGFALGFQYHEVAWEGACNLNDGVFDACLLLNGNFNPAAPPFLPLLPAGLQFANPILADYRDRLATAASQFNCAPQPLTRQRRFVV